MKLRGRKSKIIRLWSNIFCRKYLTQIRNAWWFWTKSYILTQLPTSAIAIGNGWIIILSLAFPILAQKRNNHKYSDNQINDNPNFAVKMKDNKRIEKHRKKSKNPNSFLFFRLIRHIRNICWACKHNKAQERKKSIRPTVKHSHEQKGRWNE